MHQTLDRTTYPTPRRRLPAALWWIALLVIDLAIIFWSGAANAAATSIQSPESIRAAAAAHLDHLVSDTGRDVRISVGTLDSRLRLARCDTALRVLRAKCDQTPVIKSQETIRIDIVIRENLPTMK